MKLLTQLAMALTMCSPILIVLAYAYFQHRKTQRLRRDNARKLAAFQSQIDEAIASSHHRVGG